MEGWPQGQEMRTPLLGDRRLLSRTQEPTAFSFTPSALAQPPGVYYFVSLREL